MHKDQDYSVLLDEVAALDRLSWWRWLNPIAPTVWEYFRVDDQTGTVFSVVECFGSDSQRVTGWVKLSELLNLPTPLWKDTESKVHDLRKLQIALYSAVRRMHMVGVVHGDLKDEHILIRRRKGEKYDFSNIRLIDFGFSYVEYDLSRKKHAQSDTYMEYDLDRKKHIQSNTWKGGTPGFYNPIYWNKANRYGLTRQRLHALDYYSANTILFYALTGECFPASSATYSSLADGRGVIYKPLADGRKPIEYYKAVDEALTDYMKKSPLSSVFLKSFLADLCRPNDFSSPVYTAGVLNRLRVYINRNTFSVVASLLLSLLLFLGLELLSLNAPAITVSVASGLGVIWLILHPLIRAQVFGEISTLAIGGWTAGILLASFFFSVWFGGGAILSSGVAVMVAGLFVGLTTWKTYRFQDEIDDRQIPRSQRLISTGLWLLLAPVVAPLSAFPLIPLLAGRFYSGSDWRINGIMIGAVALSALFGWLTAIFRQTPFLYGWSVPQETLSIPTLMATAFIWIGLFFAVQRSQKWMQDHTSIWSPLLWLMSGLFGWGYPFLLALLSDQRMAFGNYQVLSAFLGVFVCIIVCWPMADAEILTDEEEPLIEDKS
jgi:serine/threonine protein kinase